VHRDQLVELRLGGLGERGVHAGAGVVDQLVKTLALPGGHERAAQAPGEGRVAGAVGDVELQRDGAPAERLDLAHHRVRLLLVALVGEHDVGALLGELQRDAAAEAAAAAGDDGYGGRMVHGDLLDRLFRMDARILNGQSSINWLILLALFVFYGQ